MPLPTTRAGFAALAWLAVANSIGGVVLLFVLLRRGTGAGVSGLLYLVPAVTAPCSRCPSWGSRSTPRSSPGSPLRWPGSSW